MAHNALMAARALAADDIDTLVLNFHTVKPFDVEALLSAAKRAGKVITIEEHQRSGGLGSAVTEVLAETYPVPVKRLGVDDQFGQSGEPDELIEHYGLSASRIAHVAREFLKV
jgi:transketolase